MGELVVYGDDDPLQRSSLVQERIRAAERWALCLPKRARAAYERAIRAAYVSEHIVDPLDRGLKNEPAAELPGRITYVISDDPGALEKIVRPPCGRTADGGDLRGVDHAAGFVPLPPVRPALLEWDAPRTHAAGAFPARAMGG